jgi:6-phosphogluconolactonase
MDHHQLLLIGTYTTEGAEGIYAADFDPGSGHLAGLRCVAGLEQPSYLAVRPGGRNLYSVSELVGPDGRTGGTVASFAMEQGTGTLRPLTSRPSGGAGPCYVTCHPSGRWVAAANFVTGTVVVYPVEQDGALGLASCTLQHPGAAPRAHCIRFDPTGQWAYAADLGIDRVMLYRFDDVRGLLTPFEPPFLAARQGAGPRAVALVPGSTRACVVNELDSTLMLLELDPARGRVGVLATTTTLPAAASRENACADVHVHPNGRFVYCSNRGHNSIAVFALRGDALEPIGHQSTTGRWPRSFCLSPDGTWLLAANQHTHNVATFRVDAATGALSPTGALFPVPAPVCVAWGAA